jgi:lipid II:glycine glycyltransferase (peptidoglycan interpeptide bridge formation enzyme)
MSLEIVIDDITQTQWQNCANNFADYSIYQTWAYQQQRAESEGLRLSRFIIKNGQQTVSMGQLRIMQIKPLFKIGYLQWGPLLRSQNNDILCSSEAFSLLREAYLGKRVNIIRIVPNIVDGQTGRQVSQMIQAAGFSRIENIKPYRTISLPLDKSEEELRKNLDPRWRNKLNKAIKANLEIKCSTNGKYFAAFENLYKQLSERKKFTALELEIFKDSQKLLHENEKMRLIAAYCQDEPITVNINSCLGDTAIVLFAAGGQNAHSFGANNLTWWQSFMTARQAGMKFCDLGGIDPENNPGVYDFKNKVGGKETFHIGTFEACSNNLLKVTWQAGQKIHNAVRKRK